MAIFLLYCFVAKHLPVSCYPGGRLGKHLRYLCSRNLLKKCGTEVNIESGADFLFGDTIEISNRSGIGVDAWIRAELVVGNDVMMGPGVIIYGRYHNHERIDIPMNKQGLGNYSPVIIEDDVMDWGQGNYLQRCDDWEGFNYRSWVCCN